VKKSATLNMGNKIMQALAGEPAITHAIMALLIDEHIKTHEKQTAKLIATEAPKNLQKGLGQNQNFQINNKKNQTKLANKMCCYIGSNLHQRLLGSHQNTLFDIS
jgi:hypothetical protein